MKGPHVAHGPQFDQHRTRNTFGRVRHTTKHSVYLEMASYWFVVPCCWESQSGPVGGQLTSTTYLLWSLCNHSRMSYSTEQQLIQARPCIKIKQNQFTGAVCYQMF